MKSILELNESFTLSIFLSFNWLKPSW